MTHWVLTQHGKTYSTFVCDTWREDLITLNKNPFLTVIFFYLYTSLFFFKVGLEKKFLLNLAISQIHVFYLLVLQGENLPSAVRCYLVILSDEF